MADRVHPRGSPPSDAPATQKPSLPSPGKPVPPPGNYVIQVPKDQVYRVPPPENARRYNYLSKRKSHRSFCCRCCCCFCTTLLVLILTAAIGAAVVYFVFKPESPNYTVDSVAIKGFNLTSSAISPVFDVSVRASNPNDKIGIFYEKGSSVKIYYDGTKICDGVLPVFYQPTNNVTVFSMPLKGSAVELTSTTQKALLNAEKQGMVPFTLRIRAPVKIKVGSVKSWKITVKVTCTITVNKLTASSKILSKDCNYGVNLW